MFCLIALIVFSVIGIFSATHRRLAKQAFDCVFKRITLRPCDTGFDQKIKGKIIGKLINRSPKLAKHINRFWEPISWLLVIVFFVSLFFSVKTVYNLVRYKTCDPQDPQNCVFIPKQEEKCQCENGKATCQGLEQDNCEEECEDCGTICDKED